MTKTTKPEFYEPQTDVWEEASQAFEKNSKARKAIELHKARTHNCAQAVLCSFSEELSMDEEDLYRLSEGLSVGIAANKRVCGALIAADLALSHFTSDPDLNHWSTKETNIAVNEMHRDFKDRLVKLLGEDRSSIICKEIIHEDIPLDVPCTFVIGAAAQAANDAIAKVERFDLIS